MIVPWTMHVPVKLYQLFPALVEWAMGRMANSKVKISRFQGFKVLETSVQNLETLQP